MKEKLRQFMVGRYGVDQLNRFLITATMVLLVLDLFTRSFFISWLGILGLVYCYFRMFSKNVGKRYEENQKFMAILYTVQEAFKNRKFKFQEHKTYHIYKCPNCKQKIRVPRGKGKISIHCPKCQTDFIKKS